MAVLPRSFSAATDWAKFAGCRKRAEYFAACLPRFLQRFQGFQPGTPLAMTVGERSSGDRRIEELFVMSVSSAGSSSSAYAYLQSLLQQQGSTKNSDASGRADPLTELLATFYPAGGGDQTGSTSTAASATTTPTTTASPPCPTFSPGTLG